MDDLIQMKHFTNPQTIKMLDKNVPSDDYSQFSTPGKHNHSTTEKRFHVPLISDSLQYKHDIKTKTTRQKFLSLERSIFVFKITEEITEPHSVPNK